MATRLNGRFGHVLCWQEALGSVPVADCYGMSVDCLCIANKDIWVYFWFARIYVRVHKECAFMETGSKK